MAGLLSKMLRTLLVGPRLYQALPFSMAHRGVIIMCHRVVADEAQLRDHPLTSGLWVSVAKLKASFDYFSRQGYAFVSLGDLLEGYASATRSGVRPFVAYTFDDGFVEIAKLVEPLFRKAGVPFVAFIPSCNFNSNWVAWPFILEAVLTNPGLRAQTAELLEVNHPIERMGIDELYRACCAKFGTADSPLRATNLLRIVERLRNGASIAQASELLSQEEVGQLAQSPVAVVAGHTQHHLALDRFGLEIVRAEILEGNRLLAQVTGQPVDYFSYPYGALPRGLEDGTEALKFMRVRAAVTTEYSCVTASHLSQAAFLPRISLSDDVSLEHLDVRFNRITDAIRSLLN